MKRYEKAQQSPEQAKAHSANFPVGSNQKITKSGVEEWRYFRIRRSW